MDHDAKIDDTDKAIPLTENMSRAEYESKREVRIKVMFDEVEVVGKIIKRVYFLTQWGMDVVLQRDIGETMINNFNPVWMMGGNGK